MKAVLMFSLLLVVVVLLHYLQQLDFDFTYQLLYILADMLEPKWCIFI